MKIKIGAMLFIFGLLGINVYAQTSRDILIQKELACIDQHKNAGLTWDDVCYTAQPSDEERLAVIDDLLDKVETSIHSRVHTFTLDSQEFYNHYSEAHKARTVSGVWGGIGGQYTYRPSQGSLLNTPVFNYYSIDGFYATGKNKVDENEQRASDNSITKLVLKDIPGYMFDDRVLIGRDFTPEDPLRLTPYSGFGVRYKTDQSAGHLDVFDNFLGSSVAAIGFNFSDLYYYVPAGLTIDYAAIHDFELSWNIEYDYLVKGYENDDYANLDQYTLPADFFTNQNLRYTLEHGWGARSSLKFLKHFSMFDIYFEPYLRYWHINPSKVASGNVGGGPFISSTNKNSTYEIGSSLGIQF